MDTGTIRRGGIKLNRTDEEEAAIHQAWLDDQKTGRRLLANRIKNRQEERRTSSENHDSRNPIVEEAPNVQINEKKTEQERPDEPFFKEGDELFRDKVKKPWRKAKRFIQFPRIIIADKRLSNGAVNMACILAMFDMRKKGKLGHQGYAVKEGIVFPSLTTLARAIGKSKPMVISYIKELHEAGYIYRRKRYSKSNLYIMWLPIISSVEEVIRNYHVLSCPLMADDFEVGDNNLKKEVIRLFEIIQSKKAERQHYQDHEKELNYDDLEREVLWEYRNKDDVE